VSGLLEQIMANPDVAVPILKALGKNSPVYKAVLSHFNVSSPALIAGQLGKISQATQPTKRKINITR
jgi:hypothetical protein